MQRRNWLFGLAVLLALVVPVRAVAQSPVFFTDDAGRIQLVAELAEGFVRLPARVLEPDSALIVPNAIGWGAQKRPCETYYLWKVYVSGTGTGTGTLSAAIDSIAKYNGATTCQYVQVTRGGNYGIPAERVITGIHNVRISGQTASGGGVNISVGGRLRVRRAHGWMFEYLYQRHGGSLPLIYFECLKGGYFRNLSHSGYGTTGGGTLLVVPCETTHNLGERYGDITLTRNLVGEPNLHPTCYDASGTGNADPHTVSRVTWYENAAISCQNRGPLVSGQDSTLVAAQVDYNFSEEMVEIHRGARWVDVRGVYARAGPWTPTNNPGRNWPVWVQLEAPNLSLFAECLMGTRTNYTCDPVTNVWSGSRRGVACDVLVVGCAADGDPLPTGFRRNTPMTQYAHTSNAEPVIRPMTRARADSIFTILSGNNARLTCSGEWETRRDAHDLRFIEEWTDSTGATAVVSSPVAFNPSAGTACADTDNDGLFDEWEIAQAGNLSTLAFDTEVSGRIAYEWMLESYGIDGRPLNEEPGPVLPASRRRVWLRAYTCDSDAGYEGEPLCWIDTSGSAHQVYAFPSPARDSALVITVNTDSLTVGPPPIDVVDVADVCLEWGCQPSRIWTRPIPGDEN